MSEDSRPQTDAAARSLHRLAFLARAGEQLAASLDYATTLGGVARLAIPELGDFCVVDVVEGERLHRVAAEHVRADKQPLVRALTQANPDPAASPAPAGRVLASGMTERIEVLTAESLASHTHSDAHLQLVKDIGIRSSLAVPMIAHGRVIGVMSLGVTESDRRYDAEDQLLAEELARRAALAVENARLYRSLQDELQRRERAESELRLSEQRFRAIMEQSPLSTQRFAPDGRTIGVNEAFTRLWGLSFDALAQYNVLEDPQLEEKGIAPLLRRAFEGTPTALPAIVYDVHRTLPELSTYEDATRWITAYAYPVRDDAGVIREVVLVHNDVTDARRAEARLLRSEERLNEVLIAGGLLTWDWDMATGRVECSGNAREFFGMEVGQRDDFMRTIHPDDLPLLLGVSRAAIETGEFRAIEYRLRTSNGRERWVQTRGQVEFNGNGEPVRMFGITVEVTERHRAEAATRLLADAGEALGASLDYATTLDNLARIVVPQVADWFAVDLITDDGELERVAVYHPDPERVAIANEFFRRYPPRRGAGGAWNVIETRRPEWASEIPEQLIIDNAVDAEQARMLINLQLRSYILVPLIARDTVIGVLTLVYAESQRRYEAPDVAFALDLARRAAIAVDNARLHLQLQDEHRRKDEFLATLAHELRNPLAPLRTGLALLQATDDPATAVRARTVMERQLGHMVRLIDDLLDLSRVTRGAIALQRRRVAVGDVITSALEASRPLLDAAGLTLAVDIDDADTPLDADDTRLAQVLTNLLNNAAKFTPAGGRVEVRVRRAGANVGIEVVDTGIGLAPLQIDRIFEMFERGEGSEVHGGLGIGLTLARRLAELHGGRLHAESDGPGRGSRFVLDLPVASAAQRDTTTPAIDTRSRGGRRVLVVDDNTDAALMLAALLELDGHDVRSAGSGDDALAVVDDFVPDIAFLDLGMPGMSGFELAGRLRADPRTATTRLIALTGWGRDEDRDRTQAAGFDAHLTKPVDPAALLGLLA
ncbi:response regulator [Lysobacter sp. TY2-98]|uniref:ATP-binding protein n=1 Tax=Lysobacter sp. TY2-98 TaxID=2290922 RepID=UPI000E2015E8|nr:ATP-binding protein [Lysobacter sp. TY2-98]AXK73390.1 response regulator [Lysobacter sp. TY2-98]